MNFLDICRNVAERCSITGTVAGTVGQTGDHARVVRKVNEAWMEIQGASDLWRFMRQRFQFNTVANKADYPVSLVTENIKAGGLPYIRRYLFDTRSVACWPVGNKAGRTFLGLWDFHDYEDAFVYGVTQPGAPSVFSVDEDNTIWLGSVPNDVYTISGTLQLAATPLVSPNDVPLMPEEHHSLIEHLATMKIAMDDNLPEVFSGAQMAYTPAYQLLERAQKDQYEFGGPLA
jgi:hypothetical protein